MIENAGMIKLRGTRIRAEKENIKGSGKTAENVLLVLTILKKKL
jgi:hypothetical protein